MNRLALAVLLLVGCHGDPVDAVVTDTGVLDTGVLDTSSVDTGADVADKPCNPTGNLVPNGDFSSGIGSWLTESSKLEVLDGGPCGGKLARVHQITNYGDITENFGASIPKGTKLRLRAFFKLSGTPAGRPPNVVARLTHLADGGAEVVDQILDATGTLDSTWTMAENTLVTADPIIQVKIVVGSREPSNDEFAVGGISLVTE